MENKFREVFQYALKLEQDGMDFYVLSRDKTQNKLGKKIYEFLIGEEKKHIEIIKRIVADMKIEKDLKELSSMKREIKTVFSGLAKQYKDEVESNPDDVKALEMAQELENKGYNYYKNESGKMRFGSDERNLLEILYKQESQHYDLISKTLDFYRDPSNWYLMEEKGPVEGG